MPVVELIYKPGKLDSEGNEVKSTAVGVTAFDVQGSALILVNEDTLYIIPLAELEAAAVHPDKEEEDEPTEEAEGEVPSFAFRDTGAEGDDTPRSDGDTEGPRA